jgi:hypothetical protein
MEEHHIVKDGHKLTDDRETISRKNIFIDCSYVSCKSHAQYIIIPRPYGLLQILKITAYFGSETGNDVDEFL